MPHTVTVKPYLGSGPYGESYGPPFQTRARVSLKRQLVRDANRAEALAEATVILPPGTHCPIGSQLTFPDEVTVRTTLTFSVKSDARTPHHVEVTTK